ncbi:hypothetical protein PHPALM_6744 [Phytophthora palmivora]|uniref:Uncharacterized protein n=1 Tax=Phytophthora palmivora TaxID=4796 RepID=A0A2P4YE38_9STRA|nr:hypothetical protein PHPALM_6744 [Phytophthora palmivora]
MKITDDLVEILLNKSSDDPDLTLTQLVDKLEYATGLLHKEPQYMNKSVSKEMRRDYFFKLQEYQAAGKAILYMNKTNFNLSCTRTRGSSLRGCRAIKNAFAGGSQNMRVIACIGEHGLIYYETLFGSNKFTNS